MKFLSFLTIIFLLSSCGGGGSSSPTQTVLPKKVVQKDFLIEHQIKYNINPEIMNQYVVQDTVYFTSSDKNGVLSLYKYNGEIEKVSLDMSFVDDDLVYEAPTLYQDQLTLAVRGDHGTLGYVTLTSDNTFYYEIPFQEWHTHTDPKDNSQFFILLTSDNDPLLHRLVYLYNDKLETVDFTIDPDSYINNFTVTDNEFSFVLRKNNGFDTNGNQAKIRVINKSDKTIHDSKPIPYVYSKIKKYNNDLYFVVTLDPDFYKEKAFYKFSLVDYSLTQVSNVKYFSSYDFEVDNGNIYCKYSDTRYLIVQSLTSKDDYDVDLNTKVYNFFKTSNGVYFSSKAEDKSYSLFKINNDNTNTQVADLDYGVHLDEVLYSNKLILKLNNYSETLRNNSLFQVQNQEIQNIIDVSDDFDIAQDIAALDEYQIIHGFICSFEDFEDENEEYKQNAFCYVNDEKKVLLSLSPDIDDDELDEFFETLNYIVIKTYSAYYFFNKNFEQVGKVTMKDFYDDYDLKGFYGDKILAVQRAKNPQMRLIDKDGNVSTLVYNDNVCDKVVDRLYFDFSKKTGFGILGDNYCFVKANKEIICTDKDLSKFNLLKSRTATNLLINPEDNQLYSIDEDKIYSFPFPFSVRSFSKNYVLVYDYFNNMTHLYRLDSEKEELLAGDYFNIAAYDNKVILNGEQLLVYDTNTNDLTPFFNSKLNPKIYLPRNFTLYQNNLFFEAFSSSTALDRMIFSLDLNRIKFSPEERKENHKAAFRYTISSPK